MLLPNIKIHLFATILVLELFKNINAFSRL